MTIEQLKVLITAETSGLKKEIKTVQKSLKDLDKTTLKTTKSMNNSFKSLSKTLKTSAIVVGLIKIGKTAVNTASDLEEIQNVVEVSFGNASKEVDKFAANAIRQFGLSELSAKKFSSTFMAMSNSLGVNSDVGKTMALNLTGLVGDIASFYNITVEEANTAISAVYTGETESIKKLGIVLTEANLNAYAVSQGIKKTYNQMSQAEKVMLRYNYVMQASSKIQGDFVRTGGNWANQVRVLKEQWSQLLSILGKGLIQVLTPVVKALNEMLASLIAVSGALAKTFGGKGLESATGKVSSSLGDASDNAGDIAGGLDGANDSAKALAKTVAGFDELNILASNKGEDMGLSDTIITGKSEVVEGPEIENPALKLSDYIKQCKDIIDKWISTIPKLEINFDKDKALEDLKSIGLNILNTIAGWGTFTVSLGIEIANDLDIGTLITKFSDFTVALSGLASAITESVIPALQNFYESSGLKDIVAWIGEKLADGLEGATIKLNEWKTWFEENKDKIADFGTKLGEAVQPISEIVMWIGNVAWSAFTVTLDTINTLLGYISETLINLDTSELKSLIWSIVGLGAAFGGAKAAAKLFGIGIVEVIKHPKLVIGSLYDLIVGYWLPTTLVKFDKFVAGIKSGLAGLVTNIGKILTSIKTGVSSAFSWLIANPIALVIAAIVALVALIAVKGDEIQGQLKKFSDWVDKIFVKDFREMFGPVLGGIIQFFADNIVKAKNNIISALNGLIDIIRGVFTGNWKRAWEGCKTIFKVVFDSLVGFVKTPFNSIIKMVNGLISVITGGLNVVVRGINKMSIKIPDWVPVYGGESFGFNIPEMTAYQFPLLANGGVITQPTMAMMGEYPGASNNPEIVAPQNLIQQIIADSNSNVVSALIQQTRQLLEGLENINLEVSIGDDVIAQSAQRGNLAYRRRTGQPLFV